MNHIVTKYRGRLVKTTGDGILATFDGPARAIRCARAIADLAGRSGLTVRIGLHTGECDVVGDKIGGVAVRLGKAIAECAPPGGLLISHPMKDLVAGDGELRQELATGQMVEDVHDLQHDAGVGAAAALPLLRGHERQIARRDAAFHLERNVDAEVPLAVLHGLLPQVLESTHVGLAARVELVHPQEAVDLLALREVRMMPVDHRPAAQQIADRGQIGERELFVSEAAGPGR